MKIASQHYHFMQLFGSDPDFVEKTCGVLAQLPMEAHELVVEPLFDENGGVRPGAFEELDRWVKALRQIGKQVISYYFNFPAVQTAFDVRTQEDLARYFSQLKRQLPELSYLTSNPVPLDWNDPTVCKSEEQLSDQLTKMKQVAQMGKAAGFDFCYHFHSPEMANGCREFDYMMNRMTSAEMGLTLDANWCVMGDVDPLPFTRQHLDRIRLVHLRSSHGKIWDEVLEDGEEGNIALIRLLLEGGYTGPWIIELADNAKERQMPVAERWQRSYKNLRGWLETVKSA